MATHHIPYLPIGWWVLRYIEKQIKASYDEIAPVNTICRVGCPVLLVHGALDAYVPVEDADIIYGKRSTDEVQLRILDDVAHTSAEKIDCYGEDVAAFFSECFLKTMLTNQVRKPSSQTDFQTKFKNQV